MTITIDSTDLDDLRQNKTGTPLNPGIALGELMAAAQKGQAFVRDVSSGKTRPLTVEELTAGV